MLMMIANTLKCFLYEGNPVSLESFNLLLCQDLCARPPVPQIGKITILRVITKSLARHMDEHCIVGKEEVLHRFLLSPKAFVPLRRVHSSLTCRESFCTPRFLHSHPLDTMSLQIKRGMGIH